MNKMAIYAIAVISLAWTQTAHAGWQESSHCYLNQNHEPANIEDEDWLWYYRHVPSRMQFNVFVSPNMQWAVPNSVLSGTPPGPPDYGNQPSYSTHFYPYQN